MDGGRHPVVPLLAFVDDDFEESLLEALRQSVADLAARDWLIGPPQVVDQVDEFGVRTVGLVHQLYAAYDETGALLDEATDRALLEEARTVVGAVERLSEVAGVDFGIELDGGSVGWVEGGTMTDDLRTGLLDAWAARIA
jgi:hypothetical protein